MIVYTISTMLNMDGNTWLDEKTQFQVFPESKELRPYQNRPIWLILSIVMREKGYSFRNAMTVEGQMQNMKEVWNRN